MTAPRIEGGRVVVSVLSSPDEIRQAFDLAVSIATQQVAPLPIRVHWSSVLLSPDQIRATRLREISAMALEYCAVEARWELPPSMAKVADLFLVVPTSAAGAGAPGGCSGARLAGVGVELSPGAVPPAPGESTNCVEVRNS